MRLSDRLPGSNNKCILPNFSGSTNCWTLKIHEKHHECTKTSWNRTSFLEFVEIDATSPHPTGHCLPAKNSHRTASAAQNITYSSTSLRDIGDFVTHNKHRTIPGDVCLRVRSLKLQKHHRGVKAGKLHRKFRFLDTSHVDWGHQVHLPNVTWIDMNAGPQFSLREGVNLCLVLVCGMLSLLRTKISFFSNT